MPIKTFSATLLSLLMATSVASAKQAVEIPINVGIGPSAFMFTGALADEQPLHYGVHIDVAAIIDKATIKKHQNKIPKKYRKIVSKLGEARIGYMLIPDSLIISPKTQNTAIYGATWRPLSANLPIGLGPMELKFGAGVLLTYAYIGQDVPNADSVTTHFLRPGLDLKANLDVPFSDSLILSLGWSSGFYVPQELGGGMADLGEGDQSLWHVGQAYAVFNYRFPFKTKI